MEYVTAALMTLKKSLFVALMGAIDGHTIKAAMTYLLVGFARLMVDGRDFRSTVLVLILCVPTGFIVFNGLDGVITSENTRNVLSIISAFICRELAEGLIKLAKLWRDRPDSFFRKK